MQKHRNHIDIFSCPYWQRKTRFFNKIVCRQMVPQVGFSLWFLWKERRMKDNKTQISNKTMLFTTLIFFVSTKKALLRWQMNAGNWSDTPLAVPLCAQQLQRIRHCSDWLLQCIHYYTLRSDSINDCSSLPIVWPISNLWYIHTNGNDKHSPAMFVGELPERSSQLRCL
jgi:hypothetical protein